MEGTDALLQAVNAGDATLVSQLLTADPAAVAARSADGWTPLHLAAYHGHADVARALLAHGADVAAWSANAMANTPLHAAIAGRTDPVVVELLLAAGAHADAAAGAGVTPLHLAASRGAEALVRRLLALGADPGAHTADGKRAADIARERGHATVADLLDALPPPVER